MSQLESIAKYFSLEANRCCEQLGAVMLRADQLGVGIYNFRVLRPGSDPSTACVMLAISGKFSDDDLCRMRTFVQGLHQDINQGLESVTLAYKDTMGAAREGGAS